MADLIDDVSVLIAEVADELIVPRWRALDDADIREKQPGDLVTVADVEAEHALTPRLAALVPGSVVIGEEAVAADPTLLDGAGDLTDLWVVDPVDGTYNFTEGSPDFGVMVAQIRRGEVVRGWIHLPIHGETLVAELGGGASTNGTALRLGDGATDAGTISGAVKTRYLPDDVRPLVEAGIPRIGPLDPSTLCSAVEYRRVAHGEMDYVFYWQTNPWDHAPGSLIVAEAGGRSCRLDGQPYRVGDDHTGLLVARGEATWDLTRRSLLADL